ncbi:Nucleotide-binding alpha-beta plait domain containing protein [Parasponia andersonii]|uniref:Nucleotide-binding alpha-beta plait domain containing protein n=1 Tax=Parasponia andersonii TaxID=3476 RepID=A0A2P5ADV0_PARAD|nr:Nucleotide-binding alpha-beta plait domain containing protein [Parasponia andersonii]
MMKDPLARTKVVIRHLPPSLSQSDLFQQIHDRFSGRYNWFSFRPGKISLKNQRYSRAYIEFNRAEDVIEFAEFFDGHVFVNEKGLQHKAIVEYAPSQRVPKPSRRDGREGTIYKDPDYLEFLKLIAKPAEHLPSAEIQLERKEAEQAGAVKESPIITPLMEYVRQRRAVESGAQSSVGVGKVSRRSGVGSSRKRQPGSSSTKRISEKKKYILKDKTKSTSRKDKSTFIVVPRREDQLATSTGKETSENETVSAIEGSVSGIPVIADSGRKKFLLLKGKKPETVTVGMSQSQDTSLGNSSGSASPKQNQRRDGGGRLIRSIILNNEARLGQSSNTAQPQQRIQILNSENVKRLPRPANMRSGLNGHVSHNELSSLNTEGDRKKDSEDKFMKKDMHNVSNISEKQEKRTRNKDRPDRGVWAPLRRADVSHASDERMSSSVSQASQLPSETVEGSHRNLGRRGSAHNMKDETPQSTSEGKSSKRGASVHGSHEKQVWVQKSSAGS